MRQIKFRVWDKELGMMCWEDIYNAQIKNLMNGENILMQYTGLKDKNDKEIYEGDIVQIKEEGLIGEEMIYEVKNYAEEGYPAFDLALWDGDSNGLAEVAQGTGWEIEVIGNIYENKDLVN